MVKTGNVTVKKCKLKSGYNLKITMAGNGGRDGTETSGGFKVKTEEGAALDYTVQKGTTTAGGSLTTVDSGKEILTIAAGKDEEDETLTFTLQTKNDQDNYAETAGEYIGYAIFTAKISRNT